MVPLEGCRQPIRLPRRVGSLACLLCLCAGCSLWSRPTEPPPPPVVEPTVVRPVVEERVLEPVTDDTPRPPGDYVLIVRVKLMHVEVPAGTISASERLWSYLDEEIADPDMAATLNRNGFRVGRGRIADWDQLGRLLREMTGQTPQAVEAHTIPGQAVPVVLQERQDIQTIFTYNLRGELAGRDYPAGDNLLMVACRLNPDDPSTVLVHGVPLVRTTKRYPTYRTRGGMVSFAREPQLVPLEGLEFRVNVPLGHYLAIGPGALSRRQTSAGHHFLVGARTGLPYEKMLVIVPEVFADPVR